MRKIKLMIFCLSMGVFLGNCAAPKPAPDNDKTKENAQKSFDSLNKEEQKKHQHKH